MRIFQLMVSFLLLATISNGQETDFDLGSIKFRGVEFNPTKEQIIKAFGQPKWVETNYECGAFTNDQPGGPFHQLVYTGFNYIGGVKEDDLALENVSFDRSGQIKMKYREIELSARTSKEDIVKIFGNKAKEHFEAYPDDDAILLYSKDSDDGAIFTFKNGKLSKFEYWTPC